LTRNEAVATDNVVGAVGDQLALIAALSEKLFASSTGHHQEPEDAYFTRVTARAPGDLSSRIDHASPGRRRC
jgi:hypothetical protein